MVIQNVAGCGFRPGGGAAVKAPFAQECAGGAVGAAGPGRRDRRGRMGVEPNFSPRSVAQAGIARKIRIDPISGGNGRAVAAAKSSRRTATREERRQQLILATIKCISRKGLGSITLGDVAQEAGLSQGIVNLHFTSKENLLNETLQYLAE